LLADLSALPFMVPTTACLATELVVACALLEDLVATPIGTTSQPIRIEDFVVLDHGE
jgi:hypothetical protein